MTAKSRQSVFALTVIALFAFALSPAKADVRAVVHAATKGFKDVSMTCRVIRANHDELQRIGKDFEKSYEIKTSRIEYKAPDKMKMEGKLGLVTVTMIINGDQKAFIVPSIHYTKRENIKGKPHQRQTELDLGVLTASLWRDYIVSSSVRDGSFYKIVYARSNSPHKKMILWADCKSLCLTRVDKLDDDGKLKSKYIYSGHKKLGGIWVPTKIDIFSSQGKLAAETGYDSIKVNSGIADSTFKL